MQQPTHHIHGAEDVAVVVAGLQVLGDVGEGAEILRVLSSAGDVPDLVLSNDILSGSITSTSHPSGDGKYTQQTTRWLWHVCTGGREQRRYWQRGSLPARSVLAPSHGRNQWKHGPQPVCQAFGIQVTPPPWCSPIAQAAP